MTERAWLAVTPTVAPSTPAGGLAPRSRQVELAHLGDGLGRDGFPNRPDRRTD